MNRHGQKHTAAFARGGRQPGLRREEHGPVLGVERSSDNQRRRRLRFSRALAIVLMAGVLGGCATLLNSRTKSVAMSSNPAAAEVWIDGANRGVTPITVELNNHESHTVVFRKDGYQDVVCELTASVGAVWVILDVLGGLVPVIVDAATGEWKAIEQDACNVNLPSGDNPSSGDAPDEGNTDPTDWAAVAKQRGWVVLPEAASP